MTGAIFDVNYLSYLSINFQNSGAYLIANFLNFFILTLLLYFGRVEDNKIAKNKVEPILWDTRYLAQLIEAIVTICIAKFSQYCSLKLVHSDNSANRQYSTPKHSEILKLKI